MQANEFEKNIQSKMESFILVPSDEVWNKVAERIALQKRKRRAAWWFFSGIFLCGALLIWFFKTNGYDEQRITETTTAVSQETNNLPAVNDKSEDKPEGKSDGNSKDVTVKEQPDNPNSNLSNNEQPIANTYAKPNNQNELRNAAAKSFSAKLANQKCKAEHSFADEPLISSIDKIPFDKAILNKAINHFPATDKRVDDALLPSKNDENRITLDSLIAKKERQPPVAKPDTFKNNHQPKSLAIKKEKWLHGFNVYAGISDNKTSLPQTANEGALFYSPANSFGDRSSSNLYSTSFSFGLGGFVRKQLNEKFCFTAGLDYHFYLAKSWMGSKVTEPFNAYDSTMLQGISVNEYYRSGSSIHFSNQYHLLEFPLGISYRINNSIQRPLTIGTGITPAWLIGSRALFDNKSKGISYTDKTQFHRFHLSFQANISFTVKNAKGFQIQTGPVFQYQLTNLSKPVNAEKQQLIFTGIKTNFIFK